MISRMRAGRAVTTTIFEQVDRLLDRMRDQHHRLALGRQHLQQQVLHRRTGLRIERAERLVHQQELRVHRIGARDRQPLAHAARQRLRLGSGEIRSPIRRM